MKITLKPLDQQVMVITGASSGIGLVTARLAAKAGARLVLAARNEAALQQLAQEIRRQGGQALAVAADVGDEDDVLRIAEAAITEFGTFDTWVNNAGVSIFGHCEEVSIADMRRMFDTVYWGAVYGSRAAVAHFRQRGEAGALINIGSFFGDRATPVQSTYCTAKHALHGWTNALRMELEMEKAPVSVTLIHPGRIDTPYNEHAQSYYQHQVAHRGMVYPPSAVAEAILFAAAHPKRDMYVGFQAKVLKMVGDVAPRFLDKLMEVVTVPGQVDPQPPLAQCRNQRPLQSWLRPARARLAPRLVSLGQHLRKSAEAPAAGHRRRGRPGASPACAEQGPAPRSSQPGCYASPHAGR
jgi:short-subunit dehydrogenase